MDFVLVACVFLLVMVVLGIVQGLIEGNLGRRGMIAEHLNLIHKEIPEKKNEGFFAGIAGKMSNTDIEKYMAMFICITFFAVSMFLFKSYFIASCLALFGLYYPKYIKNKKRDRRNALINEQFKDALSSLTASLKAGLSINSAIIKCVDDLQMLHGKKEKVLYEEFKIIKGDLELGMPLDDVLRKFAIRMKVDDISDFVDSIIIVRQKGGNLVQVMTDVSNIITDKIKVKNEIRVLTASKQSEAGILSFIPIGLVVLLTFISPKYMQPLYETGFGKVAIVFAFCLIGANYLMGKKITNIKV